MAINPFNIANTLGYYEFRPHPVTGAVTRYVDVGRLCTHPNINKWSRWKPVRHGKTGGLTEADLKSVRHGMAIPYQTTPSGLMTFYRSNPEIIWGYDRPRGGTSAPIEPYRIGDFGEYDHYAGQFYQLYYPVRVLEQSSPKVPISLDRINFDPTWLDWACMDFDTHFLGAIVSAAGDSVNYREAISATTIGNGTDGASLSVPIPSPILGREYDIFTFIAEAKNPPYVDKYYPLEGGFGRVAYSKTVSITLDSRWANGTFYWTFRIENYSAVSMELGLCRLFLRYGDNATGDPQDTGEVSLYLPSPLTVPSNGVYEESGNFPNALPDFEYRDYGYMYFTSTLKSSLNQVLSIDYEYW